MEGACTALLSEVSHEKNVSTILTTIEKAKMKIHVLLLSYEALISRIVSITSVRSDIHPGIWSIAPWYLSKDYIEFQRSRAQSRNCPEQLPQMAGSPFKLTSAAFRKGPNTCDRAAPQSVLLLQNVFPQTKEEGVSVDFEDAEDVRGGGGVAHSVQSEGGPSERLQLGALVQPQQPRHLARLQEVEVVWSG